jgi:hypothetical protein
MPRRRLSERLCYNLAVSVMTCPDWRGGKTMGLFDIFRRSAKIRDAGQLAEFIDQHAAFVVQKGIYEYARARAAHYAKVLFREPEFQAACDRSRWLAYPIGLAWVAEIAEGALVSAAGPNRLAQVEAIRELTLAVFDRYPVPAMLGPQSWGELRVELANRLSLIGLHPPKPAKDVPETHWESYFDLMPIHEKLRGRDALTTRNYLRVTLINIHDELTKRLDPPAVASSLRMRRDLPPLAPAAPSVAPN